MFYLVLVIVCSIDPGFVGDHDSGSTCLQFYDRPEIHYYTLEKCSARAREIVDAVRADMTKLEATLPGPWSYRAKCYVPVIDENQLA